MKATICGWNYEGANFRGYFSETDERLLMISIEGNEQDVIDFILNEFSYGNYVDEDDYISSFKDLIKGYAEGMIPNGDGCGGVISIIDDNGEIWTFIDNVDLMAEDPIQLGEVNVPSSKTLNELVAEKAKS